MRGGTIKSHREETKDTTRYAKFGLNFFGQNFGTTSIPTIKLTTFKKSSRFGTGSYKKI
jgi:hypothetical protein